jgi:hypothetical protein
MPTESDSLVDDEGADYLYFEKKPTPVGKIPARQEHWPNSLPVPGKLYTAHTSALDQVPIFITGVFESVEGVSRLYLQFIYKEQVKFAHWASKNPNDQTVRFFYGVDEVSSEALEVK